jgi:hypothetical protein
VEAFVDFVKAVGIAGIAQHPQFLVDGLQPMALRGLHPLGGKAGAQRFQLRHRLEHPGQPLDRGPRHHCAAMRARIDQAGGRELAERLAHRRARYIEALCDVGFVEGRSRRQRAAHDFVGELQAQLLRPRDLVRIGRGAVDAANHHRLGLGGRTLGNAGRGILETHGF